MWCCLQSNSAKSCPKTLWMFCSWIFWWAWCLVHCVNPIWSFRLRLILSCCCRSAHRSKSLSPLPLVTPSRIPATGLLEDSGSNVLLFPFFPSLCIRVEFFLLEKLNLEKCEKCPWSVARCLKVCAGSDSVRVVFWNLSCRQVWKKRHVESEFPRSHRSDRISVTTSR